MNIYDNDVDNKNRYNGDDYSFVNFVGDSKLRVRSMGEEIDLMKDNIILKFQLI